MDRNRTRKAEGERGGPAQRSQVCLHEKNRDLVDGREPIPQQAGGLKKPGASRRPALQSGCGLHCHVVGHELDPLMFFERRR